MNEINRINKTNQINQTDWLVPPLFLAPRSSASPALTRNESVKRIEDKN